MAVEKYNIGGTVRDTEADEAFAEIQQNRVLMAEKLTTVSAGKPQIVHGLTNVSQVFEHYKPNVDIDFENEEGVTKKETLRFKSVGDFGIKGITAQSSFISDLTTKKEQYQKIAKELKSNKLLREVLKNEETKKAFMDGIHALIKELDQAGK
ncbi:MAG: hypothetical protein ABJB86_17695 [Bacteroidota bacterium]